jgi:hypothetical protein
MTMAADAVPAALLPTVLRMRAEQSHLSAALTSPGLPSGRLRPLEPAIGPAHRVRPEPAIGPARGRTRWAGPMAGSGGTRWAGYREIGPLPTFLRLRAGLSQVGTAALLPLPASGERDGAMPHAIALRLRGTVGRGPGEGASPRVRAYV